MRCCSSIDTALVRRLASLAVTAALAAVFVLPSAPVAARSSVNRVRPMEVDRISRLVTLGRRQTTVLVLYSTTCPACRKMLSDFVGLVEATEKSRGKVKFLALSTDSEARVLEHFFSEYRLPFDLWWVRPWKRGELTREMHSTGAKEFPDQFGIPYFVVYDRRGRVVKEWAGASKGLGYLKRVIRHAAKTGR